jgi:poly(A) polymerase
VNAMAMTRDGAVIDPWGGRADLGARTLRAVGEAERMLRDDPLRALRIGRFVAVLGFDVEASLRAAAWERAPSLLEVSRERWLQELDKLLVGPFATRGLEELERCRALAIVLPEVQALVGLHDTSPVHHKDVWAHTLGVVGQIRPDRVLRWAALLHDIGKPWTRTVSADGTVRFLGHEAHGAMLFEGIAARLRLDKRREAQIGFLIAEHGAPEAYTSEWSEAAIRRLARRAGEHLEPLLELAGADLTTRDPDRRAGALGRLDELRGRLASLAAQQALTPQLPPGLGRALMEELGVAQGPEVGEHIVRVRGAILDGELTASPTVAECLAWLVTRGGRG